MRASRPPVNKTIAQCRESGCIGAQKGGFHCAAARKKPVTLAAVKTPRRWEGAKP